MALRITAGMVTSQAIRYSQRQQNQLGALQEQLISGLRINRPSDDPLAYRSLLNHVSVESRLDVQMGNISHSQVRLEAALSQVERAEQLLVRIRDDVASARNPTGDPQVIAQVVDQAFDTMLDIANFQVDGEYTFSGTASDRKPYVLGQFQDRPAVTYQGAQIDSSTIVSVNMQVNVLYRGDRVFQSVQRGETLYLGSTGAASGPGVDSALGRGTLIVRSTGTSYAAGSGVVPASDAATQDTVIGTAATHRLYIEDTSGTGASGRVALNDGVQVDFTSADTNLIVRGSAGEQVSIDMSAITPGFIGYVDITAGGEMSIDGGATFQAITFQENEQLVHPDSGAVTYVDTRNVRQAGTDFIEYTGTNDVFATLIDLADDLRNTRNFSDDQWNQAITRRMDDLERIINNLMSVLGEQAVTLESLDTLNVQHEDVQLDTKRVITDLAGADTASLIIRLQDTQNLLNLTYASTVTLMDQSLLNFLA